MEQGRKPRDKPICSIYLQQRRQEKTVSSVNGAGKTGQLHIKE